MIKTIKNMQKTVMIRELHSNVVCCTFLMAPTV